MIALGEVIRCSGSACPNSARGLGTMKALES
jgi:hypothetical protein